MTTYNLTVVPNDNSFSGHLIYVKDGDDILTRLRDYNVTEEGHLIVTRQHLGPNSNMDIRISARIPRIELPVVDDIARRYEGSFNGQYVVLAILHLLRDSLAFFERLLTMGAQKENIFVLGIPYSSKSEVIDHLLHDGYQVTVAPRVHYFSEFGNFVREILQKALHQCKTTERELLIIEDGGYAAPLFHTDAAFSGDLDLCAGAVEQTANGIWADQELEKAGKLAFPIMNVAESNIKKEQESPLVGQAIIQNINALLAGYGEGLTSMKVGQLGFGSVGQPLARQIQQDGVDLTIYDLDENRREEARREGFAVVDTAGELFPRKTLIIGCTGKEVVGLNELRQLDRSVFFVNASSKLRELKYQEFLDVATKNKLVRGIGTEYRLKGRQGIDIRLLADGFPVNFFEKSESIPDKQIQFIMALLLSAAGHMITENITDPKIVEIPKELEDTLQHVMNLHEEPGLIKIRN
ncbi:MAG: hypothetical protein JW883_00380 [Deltaproteobacteria bacterium]|nr:hypothetical protein [Deltaproteobacteria bacterium]